MSDDDDDGNDDDDGGSNSSPGEADAFLSLRCLPALA
eukprot:CAMPEP_0203665840 /NCGR_PEP_ID=MMETSP0090-20130426/2997_1 /ASSEMBLY_ACC=CAM_ASM_001088 /TAXON_ID=426623 /ORGANISM="Chaetoceros affinis, Strain CCMP159" /LENGTH=36 /DNA_ID= /DNA_START= /DNA_END= /DNA_ORIENTATION=